MGDATRIQRELGHFNKDRTILGMTLIPDDKNIRHLTATIPGPVSTPYEGGIFGVDINLPGILSLLLHIYIHSLFILLLICDYRTLPSFVL